MKKRQGNDAPPGIERRAFIRALGALGVSGLAAACGGRRPSPTPEVIARATRTPRPLPTNTVPAISPLSTPTAVAAATSTSTVAPSPSLQPTSGATPTPSATPPPTATPTPTATPFPPGPPTKLGLFVSRNDPRVFDLLSTGNVALIKTMEYDPNFVAEMKQMSPQTLIVARLDLPQIHLDAMGDVTASAKAFVDQLLTVATEPKRMANIDAWEAYNEPIPTDEEQMARLGEFEAQRTRLLAAAGIRSVVGNFSTGTPPMEWWPRFRPAIEAVKEHNGFLGLHEYSAPTMQFGTPQDPLGWGADPAQDGWLTLRYRKVYRSYLEPNGLVVPLVLTEVGIDGNVTDRPGPEGMGWMDFGAYWDELGMGSDAPGNYVEQLAWYDTQLQQDNYVKGAAIFAAAASPGWQSFEVLDAVLPFLQQYVSVHPKR